MATTEEWQRQALIQFQNRAETNSIDFKRDLTEDFERLKDNFTPRFSLLTLGDREIQRRKDLLDSKGGRLRGSLYLKRERRQDSGESVNFKDTRRTLTSTPV